MRMYSYLELLAQYGNSLSYTGCEMAGARGGRTIPLERHGGSEVEIAPLVKLYVGRKDTPHLEV